MGHYHNKRSIKIIYTAYTIFSLTLTGRNDFASILGTCIFVYRDISGNPVAGPSLSDITCQIEPLGKAFSVSYFFNVKWFYNIVL